MSAVVARLYDFRSCARHTVKIDGTLRDQRNRPSDVTVEDLSLTGFRVPSHALITVGQIIFLGLSGIGARSAIVVRIDSECVIGCEFEAPLTADELAVVLTEAQSTVISLNTRTHVASTSAANHSRSTFGDVPVGAVSCAIGGLMLLIWLLIR